jgi:hypothetical protein
MTEPTPSPQTSCDLLRLLWSALGGPDRHLEAVEFCGTGDLPSCFPVSDFASACVGAAALAAAEAANPGGDPARVTVDRRLASLWYGFSIRPEGWTMPGPWDPIAGDYATADGWIRLHTNAPHHRQAALAVLGVVPEREAVAAAVARWQAARLESAVVERGGCAAAMHPSTQWKDHPQGHAVAAEPLVHRRDSGEDGRQPHRGTAARPLAGVRVLDLTRVLAGPVATRFLAGLGAEVLRIDPPGWDEPGVIPEVSLGKSCAHLDLREHGDVARLEALLADADIVVHGYRNGALDQLGLDADARRALRPGLVDVCLDAYGWTGPWAGRRGFDSLVQMSIGIAEAGMRAYGRDRPTPLPVQALDHGTGYLMAAAALRGLAARRRGDGGSLWRTSLARTGMVLSALGGPAREGTLPPASPDDEADALETTSWGPAHRLRPPASIAGVTFGWDRGASALGSADARWRS